MEDSSFFGKRRVVDRLALSQFSRLAEDPGIGDGTAPDHNAIDAGFTESRDGLVRSSDVAAADDWDGDGALNLSDYIPVGEAAVALDPGAAVDGDHRAARALDYPGDLDRIDRAFVPADSDLHRYRDRDGLANPAQDSLELRQVPKQR